MAHWRMIAATGEPVQHRISALPHQPLLINRANAMAVLLNFNCNTNNHKCFN